MHPCFGFIFKKDDNLESYLEYRRNKVIFNDESRKKISHLSDSFRDLVKLARNISESGFEVQEGLRTPDAHQMAITNRAEQATNVSPVRGFSVRVAPMVNGTWLPVGNLTQEALFLKAALDSGVAPAPEMSQVYTLMKRTYKADIKYAFRAAHHYLGTSGSALVFSDETNEVLPQDDYVQVNYFSMTEM